MRRLAGARATIAMANQQGGDLPGGGVGRVAGQGQVAGGARVHLLARGRRAPAPSAALVNTNLDLTGIDPALSPVTFGHSAVAGANSVAAYSMFRPNLPEDFTSPGPVTIYSDTNNQRLATPQVRLKPDLAAADGANNTFSPLGPARDADTQYANFYGTSAASPHAAAIVGLGNR